LSEAAVARLVTQNIDINGALFLGNSRPIRDFDCFADAGGIPVPVAANRGASGIDGTIASAAGYAAGLKGTVTVIAGDLALLHDLNSLALLKKADFPLVIVVINNDGGGIFSFLPIAECGDIFERYFGTPHGLRFSEAAKMFGLDYCQPVSKDEFVSDYRAAQENRRSTIIEIVCKRESSLAEHRAIEKSVVDVLKSI
jgi:2-succinyl-5-enolpyruvyl-6-hydroxy-3-cyclohexene-1-carboxylate synthase